MMKTAVREQYKLMRGAIASDRRRDAAQQALEAVVALAAEHTLVMSYVSIGDELCTRAINHFLAEEGKLVLPRVEKERIIPCCVQDVSTQLCEGAFGIPEPIARCAIASPTLVLVPGLAFDAANHRVGYGKGCYDRFLSFLSADVLCYGIGYREQLSSALLPIETTDRQLDSIFLY
ncbi:MAG: 5-formyltetrahydrofolate cyclo-ligase [Chlamydiales bacterium]|nr:5-formyltetrahydrofolate cyclo-ligase [Chlamydiia bacterium]MCP5507490.1 5-formyltetrahydrofolate cyclo-ligase [Chlamydiales bacterium]